MRVLVVDDDNLVLRMLVRLLQPTHEVVTARHIYRAFDELASSHFDVILCDVHMPIMSGTDFVAKLSPLDSGRVIFLSGDAKPEVGLPHPFISKPFSKVELLAAIERVGNVRSAS